VKPLFFFCQGSRPVPLIKTDGDRTFGVFPFKPDSLLENYHLLIVGKPCIPVITEVRSLGEGYGYTDKLTGKYPKCYSDRNLLEYYVKRNLSVIDFMQKRPYVSKNKLVLAGHSEGSTVAAKLALVSAKVTHLIYASGSPLGRIMSMIGQARANETDTARYAEEEFRYWEAVVEDKNNMDDSRGDTYKATFDFSIPPIEYLQKLRIPVLVCYGTKDESAPFNDYLRVEMVRQKRKNFTFYAYTGLEHNFFPLTATGQPDFDKFNWDKVALHWRRWADGQ
jgi:dienelactone hydrolase